MRTILLGLLLALPAAAQRWGDPVWSDEFDSAVPGTPPDSTKWVYDVGAGKWGNRELETYCAPGSSDPAPCDAKNPNIYQDGKGHLVIQSIRASADPAPTGAWTSGRLKTRGVQDFQYGRLEACMRLPSGAGLWPAFWLLGTVGPGFMGEIDIMENVPKMGQPGGLGPTIIETTIHGAMTRGQRRLFSRRRTLRFRAAAESMTPIRRATSTGPSGRRT
jgi:beta-glucanase (GH16 family)